MVVSQGRQRTYPFPHSTEDTALLTNISKLTRSLFAAALAVSSVAPAHSSFWSKPVTPGPLRKESATTAEKVVKVVVQGISSGGTATGSHIGRGRILTNKHVCDLFQPGYTAYILDNRGRAFRVRDYVNSPTREFDLCLLETNASDLPVIEFAPAARLRLNDVLTITGYPAGTFGIVSGPYAGLHMVPVGNGDGTETLQLSGVIRAPTIGGNSGSPVVDKQGLCVGVINAGNGVIGLFMPLDVVRNFLNYATDELNKYN